MKTEDRLEQDLRDLFTEIVENEPPLTAPVRGSTWTRRFSAKFLTAAPLVGRGLAAASLAGAVAVGAVVVPKIADRPTEEQNPSLVQPGGTEPSARGSQAATPGPIEGTTRYVDERIGFALRYPSDWTRVGSGALGRSFVAFVSRYDDDHGFEMWQQDGRCGPCPVAVPVQLINFAEHDEYLRIAGRIAARWRDQGVEVTRRKIEVAGMPTVTYHVEFPDRAPADPNDQEWCRGCRGDWFLVSWYHGTTLDLRVMALDAAAYAGEGGAGMRIVRSLRDVGPPTERLMPKVPPRAGPTPAPTVITDPTGDPKPDCTPYDNGSIPTAMTCDTYTEAVLRFAGARVQGGGAEGWLTENARKEYDEHAGGLWLYAPPEERPYRSYFVTERKELEGGTVRFTLEMNQGYVRDTGDRIRTEHVYIAVADATASGQPTPNSMAVQHAVLVSGPTEP